MPGARGRARRAGRPSLARWWPSSGSHSHSASALAACAVLASALAGCFSPSYENGGLVCAPNDRDCPEGYYCAATNRCFRNGTAPPLGSDAGASDVPDAPANDTGGGPSEVGGPEVADAAPEAPSSDAEEPDLRPADPMAQLASLEVTPGTLEPAFSPTIPRYDVNLPLFTPKITVRAISVTGDATVSLNGSTLSTHMLNADAELLVGRTVNLLIGVNAPPAQALYRISVSTDGIFTYLKAPVIQVGLRFSSALAFADNTLVVGAPKDRSTTPGPHTGDPSPEVPGAESGAAFIYTRSSDGHWQYESVLKPADVQANMQFGASVALAGDTVVVGAPLENGSSNLINGPPDTKAVAAGAAFVFVRVAEGWMQQAYLKSPDATTGEQFGASVAISQMMTTAGIPLTTVAVGAPASSGPNKSPRTGVVHVFVRAGTTGPWTYQAMPRASNPKGGNEFGSSVALSGDTLVVGAPSEDSGASGVNPGSTSATAGNSGAAFVFTRTGTTWPPPVYIKAPMAVTAANFGARIAIAGSLVAIAATGDPGAGRGVGAGNPGPVMLPRSGAVYLYRRTGAVWALLHQIKAETPHTDDLFGQGIALSATSLVVGAPFEDTTGAVYLYRPRSDGQWSEIGKLNAPNAERDDEFGNTVATEGDTVVAGAEGESSSARKVGGNLADNGALGSGAVYVY